MVRVRAPVSVLVSAGSPEHCEQHGRQGRMWRVHGACALSASDLHNATPCEEILDGAVDAAVDTAVDSAKMTSHRSFAWGRSLQDLDVRERTGTAASTPASMPASMSGQDAPNGECPHRLAVFLNICEKMDRRGQ
jgi:hypothetical protein